MDLAEFLTRYPEVHIATASDEQRLLDFFHRSPMKGEGMQLLYRRAPTFSAFLDCHSAHHFVLYVQSPEKEIEGAGTFVFRPGMVNGKREMVGYLGDLRVDNIRRWGRYWRDFYLDLMKHAHAINEFHGARYFLTGILKQNTRAQKALGESKIGYHSYHPYQMVNVLKAFRPIRENYQVASWNNVAADVLWSFHRQANLQKPLGWVFDETHHEGEWRKQHWNGFSFNDGFALSDEQGIAVSGAFWSPSQVKKIIVEKLPPRDRFFFNLARPFVSLPREGEELKCLYLTMLDHRAGLTQEQVDSGVQQLIKIGLRLARERGFHCVSIAEFAAAPLQAALRPYFTVKTDLELYFVDPARNPVADFTREIPAFEMGLV